MKVKKVQMINLKDSKKERKTQRTIIRILDKDKMKFQ